MEERSIARIIRKPSIESEPRTLNAHQIQYAREAALYVVSTRSIEEAMSIFTEGLQPVVSVGRENRDTIMMDSGEIEYIEDQLRLPTGLRDVVSAPF